MNLRESYLTTVEMFLRRFDETFASGDLDGLVSLFADDAVVLFHTRPPVVGSSAVREAFAEVFETYDTSDYDARYDTIEVHADAAYAIGEIDEVLRPRNGGAEEPVRARIVLFLRRTNDAWSITRLVTGRAAPDSVAP